MTNDAELIELINAEAEQYGYGFLADRIAESQILPDGWLRIVFYDTAGVRHVFNHSDVWSSVAY